MQENIPTSASAFGLRLVGLARRWRRRLDDALAHHGYKDASWAPLVHLEAGGAATQRDLALRCGLDDSSLVRHIDLLAARGLVERRINERDRRVRCVHLTEAGRRALDEIRAVLVETERVMLREVEDGDLDAVLAVFDRIERGVERFAEKEATS